MQLKLKPTETRMPQPEEQVIAEYLMKIFTSVLPSMTSSSSKFTRDLQETLRSLLNKPAAVGNQVSV